MVPSIMWLRPTLAKDDWQRFMSLGAGCSLSRWEFFRSLRFEVIGGIVQLSASHRRQEAMSNFSDFWLSVLLVMMRSEQNSVIHATSMQRPTLLPVTHSSVNSAWIRSFPLSVGLSFVLSFFLRSIIHYSEDTVNPKRALYQSNQWTPQKPESMNQSILIIIILIRFSIVFFRPSVSPSVYAWHCLSSSFISSIRSYTSSSVQLSMCTSVPLSFSVLSFIALSVRPFVFV